jgi:hypothetical protein
MSYIIDTILWERIMIIVHKLKHISGKIDDELC